MPAHARRSTANKKKQKSEEMKKAEEKKAIKPVKPVTKRKKSVRKTVNKPVEEKK